MQNAGDIQVAFKRIRIKKIIRRLASELSKKHKINKIVLFGSYAWGKPGERSDIDIAVISESFKEMSDIERIMYLTNCVRKLKISSSIGIDVIGFTPKEFREAEYFDLTGEIREKGLVVYKKAA